MKKIKSCKFLILTLVIILTVGVIPTCIFTIVKTQQLPNVIAAYDFKDGAFGKDSDAYIKNSNFTISSIAEFNTFAETVSYGCDYAGKTVTLENNIGGSSPNTPVWIHPVGLSLYSHKENTVSGHRVFSGTFNGNGKSISNVYFTQSDTVSTVNINYLGLFCRLQNATVKNLKLSNFTITNYDSSQTLFEGYSPYFEIGGIAGNVTPIGENSSGKTTITNCLIESFKIINKDVKKSKQKPYFSGIVAHFNNTAGSLTISNCMVRSFTISDLTNAAGYCNIAPPFISGSTNTVRLSISNCVVQDKDSNIPNYMPDNSILTVKNIYSIVNTPKLDGCSSTGGEVSNTPWYKASAYNNGYPYLRMFITWKTVNFSGTNVSSFSPASIKIPTSADNTFSSSSKSITIYDQTVTATSSFCHHGSATWTAHSSSNYTVNFTKAKLTVNIDLKNISKGTTHEKFKVFTNIECGSSITISTTTNSSNQILTCTIFGKTYTPGNDYYIKSIVSQKGEIHTDTTIIIEVIEKDYSLGFQ